MTKTLPLLLLVLASLVLCTKATDVSGTVWHDTDGDGLFESGESPFGGVTVNLWEDDGYIIAITTSDPVTGVYSFTNLAANMYCVEIPSPSGYLHTAVNLDNEFTSENFDEVCFTGSAGQAPPLKINAGFQCKFKFEHL
eukprot:gene13845-16324_t